LRTSNRANITHNLASGRVNAHTNVPRRRSRFISVECLFSSPPHEDGRLFFSKPPHKDAWSIRRRRGRRRIQRRSSACSHTPPALLRNALRVFSLVCNSRSLTSCWFPFAAEGWCFVVVGGDGITKVYGQFTQYHANGSRHLTQYHTLGPANSPNITPSVPPIHPT